MTSPKIVVTFHCKWSATVSGWRARELVEEVTGKAPLWMPLRSGWYCLPRTASDVIAAAERKGWAVEYGTTDEHAEAHARGVLF